MAKPNVAAFIFHPDSLSSLKHDQNHPSPHPPPHHLSPHVKPEPQNLPIIAPYQPPQQITPIVKCEPQNLPVIAVPPSQQQKEPHQILKAVEELGSLGAAINEFTTRFDDLQKHVDFIKTALDSRSKDSASSSSVQITTATPPINSETRTQNPIALTTVRDTPTPSTTKSEIVTLCEAMCGKGLRRYVISNLSKVAKLRADVPPALKRAPRPAKLVLDCIGRFYLQGSKAYTKQSPMVSGREASVLVLELYSSIIENEVQMEGAVRHEAEQAALVWRKRMVSEGGLGNANEIDARGLLLLIACYGIPKAFRNEDVWNLVCVSDLHQIGEALQRSRPLMARVSEILEGMMKSGMKIEAVDVAQRLGIEDKFPPQKLLTSFLRESKEALKRRRRDANNSPFLLKEANEKQLVALKSVMKFLEDRKLDPAKILPGWQFKEKIVTLEKDIADLTRKVDEKAMAKRKAEEDDFLNNLKSQDAKRQRFSGKGTPVTSSPVIALRDQRIMSHVDGQMSYGSSRINSLDGRHYGDVNNYSVTASCFYGSGASSLSENDHGATGIGVAHTVGGGLASVYGHGPTASSYAGIQGDIAVDRAGHISNHGQSYAWQGVGNSVLIDRSLNQSLTRQPSSGTFLLSPSIEGFAGLPNSPHGAARVRSSASDLYRFADAIAEEYNNSGRITDHHHLFLGTHNFSYKQ